MVSLPLRTVHGMVMLMWGIQQAKPSDDPEFYLAGFPKTQWIMSGDLINEVELATTGRITGADISSASYQRPPWED